MAYEIQGRISVKILFGTQEFPFDARNTLEFLHMTSCTRIGVPMVHLSVIDVVRFFDSSAALSDGLPITVVLTVPSDETERDSRVYNFRMNSFKKEQTPGGYRYQLDGYINAPEYWHSSTFRSIQGTATATLKKIAESCGLKFEGVSTADRQVWMPRNQYHHLWARQIASRAYRSDTSCMQLGVDLTGTMIFKDINEGSDRPTADIALAVPKQGFLLATDFCPQTFSGSLNHLSGYSSIRVEQDPRQSNVHNSHRSISVTKRAKEGSLLLNRDLHSKTQQARVKFGPINPGNVHSNYEKAYYQNLRFSNLFSSGLEILLAEPSRVKLLDNVNVQLDSPDSFTATYSGVYRTVSRTIYVQGSTYYEKLGLARRSLNAPLSNSY